MKINFECECDDEPISNINVARALIEDMRESTLFGINYTSPTFDIIDLEEIADHLYDYCRSRRKRGIGDSTAEAKE